MSWAVALATRADDIREMSAAAALEALRELERSTPPEARVGAGGKLALDAIEEVPLVFQPRAGFSREHAGQLARSLGDMGELDPILVLQLGDRRFVVDGHHRKAAYRGAKRTAIPVVYFEGTVLEAVQRAGAENTKTRLPMSTQERQDYAWRLTAMGAGLSIRQVHLTAGVSESQVSNMRKALVALGPRAGQFETWWEARRAAEGEPVEIDDGQRQAWIERQAAEYADRLYREFGTKLTGNVEVAALALSVHFGERLGDLAGQLSGLSSPAIGDEDLDF